jgi:nitrate/nitrite-specific signal transduction histidine kinase
MAVGDSNSSITLRVGIPFDAELALINQRILNILLFVLSFALLIIAIATYVVRRSVLTPLAALIQSTKNLELGKSDTHYPRHGASELVILQEQFSAMAKTP